MSDRATDVTANLENSAGVPINPATEEKQDTIILGVEAGSDLEGGGKVSVGTTAVEVTFTGTPTKSVIISGDISNTGTLFIGKSDVTSAGANSIAFLEAGESLTLDYDDATNAIFVVASIASQNFFKGVLL